MRTINLVDLRNDQHATIPAISFTDGNREDRKWRLVEQPFLEGDLDNIWIAVHSAKEPMQRIIGVEGDGQYDFQHDGSI